MPSLAARDTWLGPLDAAQVLERAEDAVRRRREAEVTELLCCGDWADLNAGDPRDEPGHTRAPGGEVLVTLGGEGTPQVRDLALLELGIALTRHPLAVRAMTADVLDLRHRLPRTFAAVLDGAAEVWVARRVAGLSRAVPAAAVARVDAAVAEAIVGVSPSRTLEIAEAAVIAADPTTHRDRLEQERTRRHASFTRADSSGLRTLIGRVTTGHAVWLDGTIDRVADLIAAQRASDGEPELTRDLLRSEALGRLANPAGVLALAAQHGHAEPTDEPQPTDEPEPTEASSAFAVPIELLARLTPDVLGLLRPTATLYVHLHADGDGVVRAEGLAPHDIASLADLLGHHRIHLRPVIDNREDHAVDAYEHPAWMRERIHLRSPADTFPHATSVSRHVDLDHPVPWDPDGPPGQTTTGSRPLSRTAHRARTHLGYTITSTPAGTVWRTPHGLLRLVDTRGRTHHLSADDAAVLIDGHTALDAVLDRLLDER